ncbi:MAG: Ig-like domain-containing protein [Cyclobacteriaceae bacterium]
MTRIFTIALLLLTTVLCAQKKLVDNSASANSPSNGPSYMIVSDDDTKMTYLGNGTQFFFIDIPNYTTTSTNASQFTEVEKVGNVIFGRGKVESTDVDELIYATTDGVTLLDYYTTAANFPRIWSQTGNGAYFGSGKFDPDNAGRDFIRVSPDLSTVTRPFNNVEGGGVDLINKNLYQVQMVPFADDKILVKAKRTASDEEYFVWDDTDQTSIQITDVDNSNADASSTAQWPLGKAYGNKVIFFYYDKLYTSDGTAEGTTEIADASGMHLHGIGGGDDFAIFGNAPDGDLEPYIYTDGGAPVKVDLNPSGSSDPRDFRRNGEYVFFVANTGDGYEPHISDGTVAGTKVLMDINTSGGSLEPATNYDRNTSIVVGNGFAFGASDGTNSYVYFTDGQNLITLNNGEEYLGLFTSQAHSMTTTEDYLYFTDEDKDVFQVAIPDNIYDGTDWSEGAPLADQSIYINADFTVSSDMTASSVHLPAGVTLTINNGATLTIDGEFYNKGTVVEDGGTLVWIEPISLINLSPIASKVETFLSTAEAGFEVGQYPDEMISQLTDSLNKANAIMQDPQSQTEVETMADNLHEYYKEVLWAQIQPVKKYKNNLQVVLGDMKQAQIKNSIATTDEIDFLLIGMRNMQVDGIRIDIFGEAPGDTETLNPNKEIYDYLYTEAKAHGFKIFANPAEFGGGRRIANNNLDELGDEVNGVLIKSNRLRDRIIEFAAEYQVDYISPFNEDCIGAGGGCFNSSQVTSIYSGLVGNVNGATIVGGDNHNLAAGINAYNSTDIRDYISVATCHNLQFQHDKWDDFIALADAKGLPVWDSEATDNPKDYDGNGTTEESRMVAAIDAGVDGLVYYNNWSNIDLETGDINAGGIAGREKYIEENTDLITAITITGNTQVDLENTTTLTATLTPLNPRDSRVYWTSSDESKATVDENGVVTAIDHGDIQITVTAVDGSGVTGTFDIKIGDTFVTNVSVSGDSPMLLGSTQLLDAVVSPEDATNADLEWSSSNPEIATVDLNGVVSALALGDVVITATSTDGTDISDEISITIDPILAEELTIVGETSMLDGSSQTLTATFEPENTTNQEVTWESDDTSILTIDATSGLVTAEAVGQATITASSTDGSDVFGTMTITVNPLLAEEIFVSGVTVMDLNSAQITQTLTTSFNPENATNQDVSWSSSDNAIASVSSEGLVTALSEGTVTINATALDGSATVGSIEIIVTRGFLAVSSISITGNAQMIDNDVQTMEATVLPENATNKEVTWSSENNEILSVNPSTGEVTATGVGTTSITATATDGSEVSDSFEITVAPLLVSNVTLSGDLNMIAEDIQTLEVSLFPAHATDQTVTWASSDLDIATVSATGKVTAIAPGNVIITATSNDADQVVGSFPIAVAPLLVDEIELSGETNMIDGESQSIVSIVTPVKATDASLSWSTSDASILSVSTTGVVTANAVGTATITATANDDSGISSSLEITVAPLLLSEISIIGETSMIDASNQTLSVDINPAAATDASVSWSSSNTAVATVDNTGVVNAIAPGEVVITATANDASEVSSSITITVSPLLVSEITVVGETSMIDTSSQTLVADVNPDNATDVSVTWSSSDESIATVDETGIVTAIAVGQVTITATANDGSEVSGSLQITVSPLLISEITISGESAMIEGDTQTLSASVSPENATDASVTWSSSDDNIATVDNTGTVTAISVGTVTITATANDDSETTGTLSIEVQPVLVTAIEITGENTMTVEETQTLSFTASPTNATDATVSWSTSDALIATVDETGLVTAIAAGTADITATANDGSEVSSSFQIEIEPIPLALGDLKSSVSIFPNPTFGQLTLEIPSSGDRGSFKLVDLSGHTLVEGEIKSNYTFDISNYKKGIYFLTIEVDGISTIEKVILK